MEPYLEGSSGAHDALFSGHPTTKSSKTKLVGGTQSISCAAAWPWSKYCSHWNIGNKGQCLIQVFFKKMFGGKKVAKRTEITRTLSLSRCVPTDPSCRPRHRNCHPQTENYNPPSPLFRTSKQTPLLSSNPFSLPDVRGGGGKEPFTCLQSHSSRWGVLFAWVIDHRE